MDPSAGIQTVYGIGIFVLSHSRSDIEVFVDSNPTPPH